ncbi:hypothetical protein GIB67_000891 [Kingdonia uniflora]|uniref:Uncharacterized protein n=1 Tax=Kingdonia uniflora TaxID=39325 RepID=A0A7J7NXN9_9MAGN|nr:hypothetical protein GIB67_000891 [Kingdonia uniflora]
MSIFPWYGEAKTSVGPRSYGGPSEEGASNTGNSGMVSGGISSDESLVTIVKISDSFSSDYSVEFLEAAESDDVAESSSYDWPAPCRVKDKHEYGIPEWIAVKLLDDLYDDGEMNGNFYRYVKRINSINKMLPLGERISAADIETHYILCHCPRNTKMKRKARSKGSESTTGDDSVYTESSESEVDEAGPHSGGKMGGPDMKDHVEAKFLELPSNGKSWCRYPLRMRGHWIKGALRTVKYNCFNLKSPLRPRVMRNPSRVTNLIRALYYYPELFKSSNVKNNRKRKCGKRSPAVVELSIDTVEQCRLDLQDAYFDSDEIGDLLQEEMAHRQLPDLSAIVKLTSGGSVRHNNAPRSSPSAPRLNKIRVGWGVQPSQVVNVEKSDVSNKKRRTESEIPPSESPKIAGFFNMDASQMEASETVLSIESQMANVAYASRCFDTMDLYLREIIRYAKQALLSNTVAKSKVIVDEAKMAELRSELKDAQAEASLWKNSAGRARG